MSFAVAPFLVLSFSGSVLAWSRVYFFVVIGVLVTMAFFHSPAKQYLREKLEARQKRPGVQLARSLSQDSLVGREPVLGVAQDPERELDEAVREMKADFVELRRRQQSVLAAKAQAQKEQ